MTPMKERRPRRSTEELRQAIAEAVLAEFTEGGYLGVTFEGWHAGRVPANRYFIAVSLAARTW